MYDVAVIGGGISGLATAYKLRQKGYDVVLLERQVRTGGKAVSMNINGFLMEHGPSSVSGAATDLTDLATGLGLDEQRCGLGPDVKKRYLVKDRKLNGISTHPLGFFTSNYLSPGARLRLLAEVFQPMSNITDETVAAFAARRFGQEFADMVVDPLIGGLFAARSSEISLSAVFPKLQDYEQTYGSVVLGALKGRISGKKMPGRQLYSWQEGIGALPATLAGRLGSKVKTGATVLGMTQLSQGYRLKIGVDGAIHAKSVVIATQPHVTAGLLETLDHGAAEAAASIHASPITVVFMGFARDQIAHPLDGIGSLSPSSEKQLLSGILFNSTMFAGRAPEDHVALTGYVIGARSLDVVNRPLEEQSALVYQEFRNLLGIRGKPLISQIHHWQRGLPQPRIGHQQHMTRLMNVENECPGIFVTGNYFSSPSVANCVSGASKTTRRAEHYLAAQPGSGGVQAQG